MGESDMSGAEKDGYVKQWDGLTPPYRTIVADPPWAYRTTTGVTVRTSPGTACAEDNYSTLTNTELAALPVASLADDDAFLFLWVTNPKLYGSRQASEPAPDEIMQAWGFKYVTCLTWVKQGTLGLGFYFRGMTEHVLFGVRGGAQIPTDRRQRNLLTAPKTGHSVKPSAFGDLVEAACDGPYVELFARQPRLGWDHWGYGVEACCAS